MANIVNPPARINRNTAADGDFLWKQDFEVLYNNDVALEQAISQASQDYTAGDGISIDPSTKAISVKTGTGIEKTEEGLSVNIEGVDGAKVELQGNTFKVSAYDSESEIKGLNVNLTELQDEVLDFERYAEEKYITSGNEMVPNHQYVYTTSGWADIGGEHATVSYWRPTYNESTGKLSWQMSPSIEAPADALVKGDRGDNGQTPEFQINSNTNFWEWKYTDESESEWRSTNTSATGPQGTRGEQGIQGYTPEISTATDTEHSGTKVTFSWPEGSQIQPTEFTIPSGAPGASGRNGTDGASGKTPKLQINSTTNYWEVSYDDGGTWTSLDVKATGPQGSPGFDPVITTSIIAPDPQNPDHKNGGTKIIISNKTGTPAEASAWNGNDGDATTVNFDTATGHTMSGNGGESYPYGVNTNVIATQDWVGQQGFITKDVNNLTNYYKNTETSAKEELTTEFAKKVDIPINLGGMYLVLRTNADGTVSGWSDLSDYCYSKSSAKTTFIQQSFIDNTLSGTGANAGNKLGVNTNAIPTKDWLDDNYLPLSGGTVVGKTILRGGAFDTLELKRSDRTSTGIIGINGDNGMSFKIVDSNNNNTQLNIAPNATMDKRLSIGDDVYNPSAYYIPAQIHIGSYSPSTDDKILHIVIES